MSLGPTPHRRARGRGASPRGPPPETSGAQLVFRLGAVPGILLTLSFFLVHGVSPGLSHRSVSPLGLGLPLQEQKKRARYRSADRYSSILVDATVQADRSDPTYFVPISLVLKISGRRYRRLIKHSPFYYPNKLRVFLYAGKETHSFRGTEHLSRVPERCSRTS